jgi:hypothetical protein
MAGSEMWMRYTKIALLVFGLGLLLGLVVVALELKSLERVASGLMALRITVIPIGMLMDWRHATKRAQRSARPRARAPARRTAAAARRPRKSASQKR